MDPDPTTARLPAGRLGRLSLRRARTARATSVDEVEVGPAPDGAAVPAVAVAGALGDVARLVAPLTRQGHVVRVSDRTRTGEVPPAAAAGAAVVLTAIVAVLARRASTDQSVHVRARTESGELVVAVQTLPAGERARPLVLGPRDEETIRRRIEGVSGRATIRTTHGGNWLALARLPL